MSGKRTEREPRVLSGWKDIANYLGKGVRTVQRYERQFKLPVRRLSGKAHASVIATKPELDAWVAASPITSAGYRLNSPILVPPAWFDCKDRFARMRSLREQIAASRLELSAAVDELRKTVRTVREVYADDRWPNKGDGGLVP